MENNLKFVKYHQPCPSCGSSDALSLNEDGSGKCFSCHKFSPSIDKQSTFKSSQVKTSMKETIKELNAHGGVFAKFEGKEYVVGVISTFTIMRVFENREKVTECSATNIAKYIDWIEGSILNEQMEQLEETVKDGR